MGRRDNQQTNTQQLGRRDRTQVAPATQPTPAPVKAGNFITNAPSNVGALFRGEVGVGDVAKRMPGVALRGAVKTAEVVTPALTNFTKTTGGIIGEGLAYATDKTVREQFRGGAPDEGEDELLRLLREKRARGEDTSALINSLTKLQQGKIQTNPSDILPTVSKTTQKGLLKDTVAAAIETAVIRSVPAAMKGKLKTRLGVGALEGLGFAVAEGMAKDETPEQIMKNAVLYGVAGSTLNAIAPWLGSVLRKEIGRAPKTLVTALKEEARQLQVTSATPGSSSVNVSTPNKRHAGYAESQGYEPYTPDGELPVIQMGKTPPKVDDGLPVIDFGGNEASKTIPPPPGTRLVPEGVTPQPKTTQASSQQSTPPVAQTPTVTDGATQKVQGEQIPIGGPTKGASRLEARLVAQTEDPAYQAGTSNYAKYSKEADAPEITGSSNPEQIRRAARAVETLSPKQIDDIVSGAAELPEGVLRTAFIKAAAEKAVIEGNSSLIARLGRAVGQAARRFGQEIQFTKNFDVLDPVMNIADILAVRVKAAAGRLPKGTPKGTTVQSYIKNNVDTAQKSVTKGQMKIKEAQSLLDSIIC